MHSGGDAPRLVTVHRYRQSRTPDFGFDLAFDMAITLEANSVTDIDKISVHIVLL